MPKIDLFPDETTRIDSYDVGAIADIDGRLFRVTSSDPNPITIRHKLERPALGFLKVSADKDVRIWQTNITRDSFDLHRSDGSATVGGISILKLIPKCQALVEKLYEWQADHEMRLKQNGYSIAHDRATCITFYDQTYDGFDNILVGVCNDKGAIVGAYMLDDIDRKISAVKCTLFFHPKDGERF